MSSTNGSQNEHSDNDGQFSDAKNTPSIHTISGSSSDSDDGENLPLASVLHKKKPKKRTGNDVNDQPSNTRRKQKSPCTSTKKNVNKPQEQLPEKKTFQHKKDTNGKVTRRNESSITQVETRGEQEREREETSDEQNTPSVQSTPVLSSADDSDEPLPSTSQTQKSASRKRRRKVDWESDNDVISPNTSGCSTGKKSRSVKNTANRTSDDEEDDEERALFITQNKFLSSPRRFSDDDQPPTTTKRSLKLATTPKKKQTTTTERKTPQTPRKQSLKPNNTPIPSPRARKTPATPRAARGAA